MEKCHKFTLLFNQCYYKKCLLEFVSRDFSMEYMPQHVLHIPTLRDLSSFNNILIER